MLRAIGFDRRWARAEGAHLYDAEGNRYLDWLGGFGMFNVGRNNPRVKAALQEALELDTPGKLALGVNPLRGDPRRRAAEAGAREPRASPLLELRDGGGRGGDQDRARGDGPHARRLGASAASTG